MTNLIIKGNRYRLIDNRSFELPLPLKYVVLKEDTEIAEYEISADESVSYRILTKYKENMITPISRPLTIADMYYFFSCRVFQDKTPFTGFELAQLGLEKYNVYSIIRKTRGITPYDTYWLRFDGDKCDYETARNSWNEMMSKAASEQASAAGIAPDYAVSGEAPAASSTEPEINVGDILNQHKVDFAAAAAEHAAAVTDTASPDTVSPSNSTMSAEDIEQLLIQSGLAEDTPAPEPAPEASSSGGNLSPDEIAKLFASNDTPAAAEEPAPAPAASSSGGNLSPDEIAKLFASNDTPAAAEEPAPAPAASSSGGNLSPDEIAKLFASNDTPAAEDTAPAAEEPVSTLDTDSIKAEAAKMSQEDIQKMLSEVGVDGIEGVEGVDGSASAEPAPAEEAAPAEPFAEETVPVEETLAEDVLPAEAVSPTAPEKSSGKMTQDDIEKMLNDQVNAVKEPIDINAPADEAAASAEDTAPAAPAEETTSVEVAPAASDTSSEETGERLSPEEIEALLGGMEKDAQI